MYSNKAEEARSEMCVGADRIFSRSHPPFPFFSSPPPP